MVKFRVDNNDEKTVDRKASENAIVGRLSISQQLFMFLKSPANEQESLVVVFGALTPEGREKKVRVDLSLHWL